MGRGEVYLRPDGVSVNVRYSRGSNGLTLDIGWPRGTEPRIWKIHFQSRIDWKGLRLMTKSYALSDYASISHPGIGRHAVRDVIFQKMEIKKPIEGITFKELCVRLLDDWDSKFPRNLNHLTRELDSGFRFEGQELVEAKLYLLTVLIGHGMVPMTYGYGDYEYDPEYAYGETPQEIIDNLHADWCARELDTPDMPALMLGWERECGGFYPDGEEANGTAGA